MAEISAEDTSRVLCEFCGGELLIKGESDELTLLHAEPACNEFKNWDVLHYFTLLNEKKQRRLARREAELDRRAAVELDRSIGRVRSVEEAVIRSAFFRVLGKTAAVNGNESTLSFGWSQEGQPARTVALQFEEGKLARVLLDIEGEKSP